MQTDILKLKDEYPDVYALWCIADNLDDECLSLMEQAASDEELEEKSKEAIEAWNEYLFAEKLVREYDDNRV